MSRLQKVKENRPELLTDERLVTMADEADTLHEIKALADTDGGKRLIELLARDAVAGIYRACNVYRTASHTELIALLADTATKIDTAKLLLGSKENLAYLDAEIERALRE